MSQPAQIEAAFDGQNWLIVPAVSPKGQTNVQTWLVVLSGVAVAKFPGTGAVAETEYTVVIDQQTGEPGPDVTGAFNTAVTSYGAPPLPAGAFPSLQVEQWAPYSACGSVFDESTTRDARFDVNTWRIGPFLTQTDARTGRVMNQIFNGIEVDMTVHESGPLIYRLPYSITLVAQLTSYQPVIT
jgi:hypothetical protein